MRCSLKITLSKWYQRITKIYTEYSTAFSVWQHCLGERKDKWPAKFCFIVPYTDEAHSNSENEGSMDRTESGSWIKKLLRQQKQLPKTNSNYYVVKKIFAHTVTANKKLDGSTLREYKSPRKRFCRQHLTTLATPTILRPSSFEFPDGVIL